MPRFVLLEHSLPASDPRGLHWDFMLEAGAALRTWALPREPAAGTAMDCESLADHRAAYLDYEGPVSGNRGSVRRIDAGEYDLLADTADEFHVVLRGRRLQGTVRLARSPAAAQRWRFEFVAE